jgi:hypothetical protein
MGLITAGMLSLALLVDPSAGVLTLAPALIAIGTGIGMVLPNVVAVALGAVPGQDVGKASAVLNTARQIGAAAGVAVGVAVFQAAGGLGQQQAANGIRAALLVSAGAAATGVLTSVVAQRGRAAEAALPATANA